MLRRSALLLVLPAALLVVSTAALGRPQDSLHTPEKGTPERKELMDALRAEYKKGTGDDVQFLVNYLKVHKGWAWADVTPLDAKGKPVAEGAPQLLHKAEDGWKVMDLSKVPEDPDDPLGPEDASPGFIRNLLKTYPGVPPDIFPKKKK